MFKIKEYVQLIRDFPQHFCLMYSNASYTAIFNFYRTSTPLCFLLRYILAELNLSFVSFLLCKTLFSIFLSTCHSSTRTSLTWFLSGVRSGRAFRNIVSLIHPSSRLKLKHITWSSIIHVWEGVMTETRLQSFLNCGVHHRYSAWTPWAVRSEAVMSLPVVFLG